MTFFHLFETNKNLLPQDGTLKYCHHYLNELEAVKIFNKIKSEVQFNQNKIKVYGKVFDEPRLTAWMGDPYMKYTYSNITMNSLPWSKTVKALKEQIEETCQTKFNSVLINLYRDGKDAVSWHADDERELGKNPTIASLSLGETRRFHLKHKFEKNLPTLNFDLKAGDLLVMKDEIQHFWLHRISPTKKLADERINLTFRKINSLSL